jgi:hypothetical protein
MPKSEPRSFGPEWYHPMTFSRAIRQYAKHAGQQGTVDFLEHRVHFFDICVIQEPHTWILVIFLKGHYHEHTNPDDV